jgi:hypothetical protein
VPNRCDDGSPTARRISVPKSSAKSSTILLYAASDSDADILYATRFFAPDPFVYLRTRSGKRILVMSDLEIDRAKSRSNADRVLSYALRARAEMRLDGRPAGHAGGNPARPGLGATVPRTSAAFTRS